MNAVLRKYNFLLSIPKGSIQLAKTILSMHIEIALKLSQKCLFNGDEIWTI